jgi:hypothetical protein
MRTRSVRSMLIMTAALFTLALNNAEAGPSFPGILIPPGLPGSSVDVRIQGYVPAPPGVNVRIDAGRPYYVQRDRVVYMERERPVEHRHYKKHKKHKRHHDDRGHRNGHDRDDRDDRHEGRGGHGR